MRKCLPAQLENDLGSVFVRVMGSCLRAANEKRSNSDNWPLAVIDSWLACDWNEPGLWLKAPTLRLRQTVVICGGKSVFIFLFPVIPYSMILSLEMHSGTAANTTLSATCCE